MVDMTTDTNKKNINELSKDEKAELMRREFEKTSAFEDLFPGQYIKKISCEKFYHKFRDKLMDLLLKKGIITKTDFPLEELHLHIPQEMKDYNFNDGVNKITTLFYENDEEFAQIYLDFIKKFVREKFDFAFYFQAVPTIRIHCPGGKNVEHYPRYHTDIGYGHPVQEINLWFNLTEPKGEQQHGFRVMNTKNSLELYRKYNYVFEDFIKDAINSKDFNLDCSKISPQIDTKAGEILVMDSRCNHSGEPLQYHTRISMDIRIISVKDYENLPLIYQGAGRMKILFSPGGCYHKLNSTQL